MIAVAPALLSYRRTQGSSAGTDTEGAPGA
jgi:hypothetical protein